jgi:hypothetical protein
MAEASTLSMTEASSATMAEASLVTTSEASTVAVKKEPNETHLKIASTRWRTLQNAERPVKEQDFNDLLEAIADNGDVDEILSLMRKVNSMTRGTILKNTITD